MDNTTIGAGLRSIFISTDNTVYATNYQNGHIQIWPQGSNTSIRTISTNSTNLYTLFVSVTGDIYVDHGHPNDLVDVWRQNRSMPLLSHSVDGLCRGLFIDTNDSLYCSLVYHHKVIRRSLKSNDTQLTIVAGTGCPGYSPDTLYYPRGIFVAINFSLYVADSSSHRNQLFLANQMNATTVAGREAPGTIELRYPTAVVLDADSYLFIVDTDNSRIIRSGPNGFRCVIACTGGTELLPDQIDHPSSMAFDSDGNIFVANVDNNRIQKFLLSSNSCSKVPLGDFSPSKDVPSTGGVLK